MASRSLVFVALALAALPGATAAEVEVASTANPIRKVVNLLQAMQKKVMEEGEKSSELHDKYLCYCKSSSGDLSASISAAEVKIPELASSIEAADGKKTQLTEDLKSHQTDRSSAKAAMAEATAIRKKEKAVYDKELADNRVNLAALKKAEVAISGGMSASFLETNSANVLRALLTSKRETMNSDQEELLAFLSNQPGVEYAPASGEIVGILKQMHDEMFKDQQDLIAAETGAVNDYEGLVKAKKREVAALSKAIEGKLTRVADLGVELATMRNDHEDTSESLSEDQAFSADLEKNCADRTSVFEQEKKTRAEELVALADTIKVLNDDEALDLFKSTLPSASASFVQVLESNQVMRSRARNLLIAAQVRGQPAVNRQHLDFILLALHGKKVGFEKVITLIDELVATLKKEQQDDDHKKEYCVAQLDQVDDKRKSLQHSVKDLATVIADTKESIATTSEDIKALKASIAALDKSVASATEQRKAESAEYQEATASNSASKEVLLFAKNRLNKFYNPKLYKPASERELSEEDRIYTNQGGDIPTVAPGGIAGTGITAFTQLNSLTSHRDAPPPPPEVGAAYTKKSQENAGVMSMIDLLVKDLEKTLTESQTEEKDAQADYEKMMADSADKRRQDTKTLTDKEAAKSDLTSSLETSHDDAESTARELAGTVRFLSSLHAECDWLLKYSDVRKAARADEVDSLQGAKAVLSGASYSLLQTTDMSRSRKFLRRG